MSDSLISRVVWEGGDLPLMELATLWRSDPGYALKGSVVGALGDAPLAVRYHVECSPGWETRSVWVEVTSPPELSQSRIIVDEDARWFINGEARPDLEGLKDVDIQVTPSTNTLPIRRLRLSVGEAAEVTAAWIQFPGLAVSRLTQSYRRISPDVYEYRSRDFRAELVVDGEGVVERYGAFWRRLKS